VTVIHSPLLKIIPLSEKIVTKGIRGLIFSSANGVNAAASLGVSRKLHASCVGAATTGTAKGAGWQAYHLVDTATQLAAALIRMRPDSPLLYLRGEHSRGDLADRLTLSGLTVREQVIYEQHLLPLSDEAEKVAHGDTVVIAPIFSPRTARQFANVWSGTAPLWLAAISEAATEPLANLGARRLRVARAPTPKKMRKAVKKLVKHAMRVEGATDAD